MWSSSVCTRIYLLEGQICIVDNESFPEISQLTNVYVIAVYNIPGVTLHWLFTFLHYLIAVYNIPGVTLHWLFTFLLYLIAVYLSALCDQILQEDQICFSDVDLFPAKSCVYKCIIINVSTEFEMTSDARQNGWKLC